MRPMPKQSSCRRSSSDDGPHPKVEVPEPLIHEFGTMSQLSTGTHTWEFKNVGDADLELWFESSTCSCTVAKLKNGDEKKTLVVKPKESTTIDLEWQTKTFHDDYTKGATIGTNDPARPDGRRSASTERFTRPVMVFPGEIDHVQHGFQRRTRTPRRSRSSRVTGPRLKIKKMTTSRPELLVAAEPGPLTPEECQAAQGQGRLPGDGEVKPGMPIGRFHDELIIETDHPLKPEVKVTLAGQRHRPDQRDSRAARHDFGVEQPGSRSRHDALGPRRQAHQVHGGRASREGPGRRSSPTIRRRRRGATR